MTPLEEASIRPVLERIGIPLERRDGSNEAWFGWNGKALNLNVHPTDALHEAAHWLIAPKSRRRFAGFGLPDSFATSDKKAEEEEKCASLLGIFMERHLGLPWRETFEDHSWPDATLGELRRIIRRLRAAGHLRGLTPTCFLGGR